MSTREKQSDHPISGKTGSIPERYITAIGPGDVPMSDLLQTEPLQSLSRHALVRAQQRGVPLAVVELLLARFDVERPVGRGCHAASCSRDALTQALRDGVEPAMLERLAGVVLILAPDGAVVTVMNRETRFARFQRGHARLGARERARMAERRRRGGGER